MKKIEGILPIVVAVFDANGKVDLESFSNLVEHLVSTGVNGLTLFGVVTEFYKLTDQERVLMMEIMLEKTRKLPDVAGIISVTAHSWEVAVAEAERAEILGADAIMLLPPFFLSPSAEAILYHMEKVANAVSIPVIVQYAPNQTGSKITPEVFVQLQHKCENARIVKVETQPPGRYSSLLHELSSGNISTLVGYAGIQMIDAMERGSVGVQPGSAYSEIYVALYRLFKDNRMQEVNRLFEQLLPFISYWMQGVELIIKVEKRILQKRGIIASSYCRHPSYELDMKEEVLIETFMEQFRAFVK